MVWLKQLGLWITKNWKWIAGSFAVFFSVIGLYSIRKNLREYHIQKKKVALQKGKRDIEVLKVKKALIESKINSTEGKIGKVDQRIVEIDQTIGKMRADISQLTRAERLDKFDELGY